MHLRFSLWRYGDINFRLSGCCQIDIGKTIKAFNSGFVEIDMEKFSFITLRDNPSLKEVAAEWFHSKWGVPKEAYENDFHDREDLSPNICAVYTEEDYRCKGIAGHLLDMAVNDLKAKGITPVYLVTDHTGYYERYGWEFLCMVQGDGEPEMTRMYIHR